MNVGADVYISIERGFEGPVEGYPLCEVQYLNLGLIIEPGLRL